MAVGERNALLRLLAEVQPLVSALASSKHWKSTARCNLTLNAMLAPNPAVRFLMSMIYKSEIPGMNKLWFGPNYGLLKAFDTTLLDNDDVPILYHNAYNIDEQKLQLFSNKDKRYPEI